MWLSDSRCGEVVEATWSSCASMDSDKAIIGKIENVEKIWVGGTKTFLVMFAGSLVKKRRC